MLSGLQNNTRRIGITYGITVMGCAGKAGEEWVAPVHDSESVANRAGPEPSAVGQEPGGEALAGERTGQPLRRERSRWGATPLSGAENETGLRVNASALCAISPTGRERPAARPRVEWRNR